MNATRQIAVYACLGIVVLTGCATTGQPGGSQAAHLERRYDKQEVMIPMRDGVRLHTAIYAPRDRSRSYPILLLRTPYSCRPYGADKYRTSLGPDTTFAEDGYIFVYQDVRGRYLSEGTFADVRPHLTVKNSPSDIDESSDTYDTIEWLLANVPDHNGRVGMWGISYPGFYAAAGMIDAHPALAAVSPQAPIADWYFDDFHHHGAFFLPHTFNFFASFGRERPQPSVQRWKRFDHGTPVGYQFFLDLGPLTNEKERHFHEDRHIRDTTRILEDSDREVIWTGRSAKVPAPPVDVSDRVGTGYQDEVVGTLHGNA